MAAVKQVGSERRTLTTETAQMLKREVAETERMASERKINRLGKATRRRKAKD